jgi:hypothetical protein
MNTPRRFNVDQELADWLEEGPSAAPDETLDGVLNTFPTLPQRRVALRVPGSGGRGMGVLRGLLQVAAVVAVVAVVGGGFVILPRFLPGGGPTSGAIVTPPSPTPTASPVTPTAPVPTPVIATAAPTPAPSPLLLPFGACQAEAGDLSAQLLDWQGAAGTRFGTIRIQSAGSVGCLVSGTPGLQLIDGQGTVFLDSASLGDPASVSPAKPVYTLHPGTAESLYALIGLQNFCAADPVGPVHVALVLTSSPGRLVSSEATGVTVSMAPCNGPGQPAVLHVQQTWSTTAP